MCVCVCVCVCFCVCVCVCFCACVCTWMCVCVCVWCVFACVCARACVRVCHYRVAKTHWMPSVYRSFSAKEPYNYWLFSEQRPKASYGSSPPCTRAFYYTFVCVCVCGCACVCVCVCHNASVSLYVCVRVSTCMILKYLTYIILMLYVHRKSSLYLPLSSVNLVLKLMGTPDGISTRSGWNRVSRWWCRVSPGIYILSWLKLSGK